MTRFAPLVVLLALFGASGLLAHPFDKVVPRINVIADLTKGEIRVEYIFEYRTLDASLEEQTLPKVGLDADGDGIITPQEKRTRLTDYCAEVLAQARLSVDGRPVSLTAYPGESDAYRLGSDGEISAVGNWLLGYVLVLRTGPIPTALPAGQREVGFYNAESRIQRSNLMAGAMRAIVWKRDSGSRRLEVSDAFSSRFEVIDGRFDRIIFEVEVPDSPWHSLPDPVPPPPDPDPTTQPEPGPVTQPAPEPALQPEPGPVTEPEPPTPAQRAGQDYDPTARTTQEQDQSTLQELLDGVEAGGWALILALLGFFLWGAWHALQPGHGKTLVAGYLIGSKGRPIDALTLGVTVTLAHVSGVYLLLAAYLIARELAPEFVTRETVQEVLVLTFGAIIFFMGIGLVMRAAVGHGHEHDIFGRHVGDDHGHDHGHDHGIDPSKLTIWQVVRLGILGGMLPCPAAVLIALWMMSHGKPVLGLILLTVFSVGLAAVLSAIGITMVYTRSYLSQRGRRSGGGLAKLAARLPLVGGLVITLIGFTMLVGALDRVGVISLTGIMR